MGGKSIPERGTAPAEAGNRARPRSPGGALRGRRRVESGRLSCGGGGSSGLGHRAQPQPGWDQIRGSREAGLGVISSARVPRILQEARKSLTLSAPSTAADENGKFLL